MATGHSHSHPHRSGGKSGSSSSGKSHSSRPTQAPASTSFLFSINELPINDDPAAGGTIPIYDIHGSWCPPVTRNGFGRQNIGDLYRWRDGIISQAFDCVPAVLFNNHTMFWCGNFNQFLTVPGDASQYNVRDNTVVHRWWRPSFEHEGTMSRITLSGTETNLAAYDSAWIHDLGLRAFTQQGTPQTGSLSGNLALLVGLIAFSCEPGYLDTILMGNQAWRNSVWHGHPRIHGRYEQRGIVASIYLDPDNPRGSTRAILTALEEMEPALLQ